MKKFMILYSAPISAEQQMQAAGSEGRNEGMALWMKWFEKHGANIVEGGSPLVGGMSYTRGGNAKLQTPFLTGYTVVQAEDMDGVAAMLQEHPHYFLPGASIQAYEMMPMGM